MRKRCWKKCDVRFRDETILCRLDRVWSDRDGRALQCAFESYEAVLDPAQRGKKQMRNDRRGERINHRLRCVDADQQEIHQRAHGKDERIGVQSFYEGQEFLYKVVKEMATKPSVKRDY